LLAGLALGLWTRRARPPAMLRRPGLASPAPGRSSARRFRAAARSLLSPAGRLRPGLAGLRGVHPPLLEVAERDVDDRAIRAPLQVLEKARPDVGLSVLDDGGDPFGIVENHPRPGDALSASRRRLVDHHETVLLVIQDVFLELHPGNRLFDDRLEQREMLLPFLEGLLHRHDAVPEHLGAGHALSRQRAKISREMTTRWISLVPS
jgi:hypothetical protein